MRALAVTTAPDIHRKSLSKVYNVAILDSRSITARDMAAQLPRLRTFAPKTTFRSNLRAYRGKIRYCSEHAREKAKQKEQEGERERETREFVAFAGMWDIGKDDGKAEK